MSMHADLDSPHLIFKPYQPPVVKMGAWPVKQPTVREFLRKHFPRIRKIIGYTLMAAYFVAVGVTLLSGPAQQPVKYQQKTDLERAIIWVKS